MNNKKLLVCLARNYVLITAMISVVLAFINTLEVDHHQDEKIKYSTTYMQGRVAGGGDSGMIPGGPGSKGAQKGPGPPPKGPSPP